MINMKVLAMKVCPRCNGRGWIDDGEDCPDCNGTGQVEDDEQEPAPIREPDRDAQAPSRPAMLGNMRKATGELDPQTVI
jgi:DnaJ-class molecular chaperone